MNTLLIATRSAGKFPEIVLGLDGLDLELKNLNDVASLDRDYEVEEPGMTLEGNALIKAMTIAHLTGMPTLADDTGLEVDALDGRPGVLTARYAPGSDEDRYRKLLGELEGVPADERTARFRTVMALVDFDRELVRTCEGVFEGRILDAPRGEEGFGYDPVFYVPEFECAAAELTAEQKNSVSHRGKALAKMRGIIEAEFRS